MASVLVAYATKYGSTREVAEAVASALIESGPDLSGSVITGAALTRSANKRLMTLSGPNAPQKASRLGSSPGRLSLQAGPCTAKIPGRQTFGVLKPSGRVKSVGSSTGNSRRLPPVAATTTLEPRLNPSPL